MSQQTIISYLGAIPTVTGTVTLFDSSVSFPSGGFHLLEQQWFQYSIRVAGPNGTGTGTITVDFSLNKGVTWRPFYVATDIVHADADLAATDSQVFADEVYIGLYKDIRVQYINAGEAPTVFEVNMALQCQKATSKVTAGQVLHDPEATAQPIAVV